MYVEGEHSLYFAEGQRERIRIYIHSYKGPSINYVDKQGGPGLGLVKCQQYYISLCSKFFNGGGGAKILSSSL